MSGEAYSKVRADTASALWRRGLESADDSVLFDVAGQTELTAAGKLLQIEPHPPTYQGSGKDYASPLRQWAGQSTANLTRAMLAVAYAHATTTPTYAGDTWRQPSRNAVAACLDGPGFQPEP